MADLFACKLCGASLSAHNGVTMLDCLRALPVAARMEAMGMEQPTVMGVPMPYWVEADRG